MTESTDLSSMTDSVDEVIGVKENRKLVTYEIDFDYNSLGEDMTEYIDDDTDKRYLIKNLKTLIKVNGSRWVANASNAIQRGTLNSLEFFLFVTI
ncbi:hypothetical protein CANMA_001898 [Candida margitis]|uniref:uncharacterized protein n=1 Tax=Candida margitis TaxID=1775924 RepID=UPI002225FBE8|nr:uncharacterized protein CANMA_001898 [Candida margitis]KAI5969093.1 hypothetical protein CANMA_001898 [Candida margitis]